jgi:hypothetical protein
MEEAGYDLRSGCLLIPARESHFEIIANNGSVETFILDAKGAQELIDDAIKEALEKGLPWNTDEITLKPRKELVRLIEEGRQYRPKIKGGKKGKKGREITTEDADEESNEENENTD